jgi:hypothetical protein
LPVSRAIVCQGVETVKGRGRINLGFGDSPQLYGSLLHPALPSFLRTCFAA